MKHLNAYFVKNLLRQTTYSIITVIITFTIILLFLVVIRLFAIYKHYSALIAFINFTSEYLNIMQTFHKIFYP